MTDVIQDVSISLLLLRAKRIVDVLLEDALRSVDLTADQGRILAYLHEVPSVPMAGLADAAVLAAPTLTRHVDKLVERGLVARNLDTQDRRKVVAHLTVRGREIAGLLLGAERAAVQALRDDIGGSEVDQLVRLLDRVARIA